MPFECLQKPSGMTASACIHDELKKKTKFQIAVKGKQFFSLLAQANFSLAQFSSFIGIA